MPVVMSSARSAASDFEQFERNYMSFSSNPGEPVSLGDYLRCIQGFGARLYFAHNEAIFSRGDRADQVYRIVSGTIRLCRYLPDGRRQVLDFLLPGDLMGLVETPLFPVSAEAVSEATVLAFPRSCFDRLARDKSAVLDEFYRHSSPGRLGAQNPSDQRGWLEAKERVASFLLWLAERMDVACGERLDFPMGRQDMADYLGFPVDTITRVLTALRTEGIILIPNAHQIVLRDFAALHQLTPDNHKGSRATT